ncbi:hypothetical protein [Pseudonocardia sp. ICBG1293]|uniref:hypothetical protein n=1 Tax=Pseudonocardia sp. ICBG1293 TaxID=2844382 RepID=UPI001CC9DDE0|nr:hypothetical protein [Pseudonocardia sp. ICBG1293]
MQVLRDGRRLLVQVEETLRPREYFVRAAAPGSLLGPSGLLVDAARRARVLRCSVVVVRCHPQSLGVLTSAMEEMVARAKWSREESSPERLPAGLSWAPKSLEEIPYWRP